MTPTTPDEQWSLRTRRLVEAARDEDLGDVGAGDLTSALLPNGATEVVANVVPRAAGVIAGLTLGPAIAASFGERLGARLAFRALAADGDVVQAGQHVASLAGPYAAVLSTERTLLNFLGRMSGVATLTRQYVEAAQQGNPETRILDTRKTIPGWRELDKYAVRAGGGHNHRFGLYDAVLIKDNHIANVPLEQLAEDLAARVRRVAAQARFVEVEVDTLAQFEAVCGVAGVDLILLDNFALDDMRQAVRRRDDRGLRGKVALEASGGVRLDSVSAIAATGVDRISVGALTHSATNLDIGLDL